MSKRSRSELIGLVMCFIAATRVLGQEPHREDIYCDFRTDGKLHDAFLFIGDESARYAVPEAGGWRIKLPARRKAPGSVGVQYKEKVPGDCVITGAFDQFAADTPSKSTARAGVILQIARGPDQKRTTRLARFNSSQGHLYAITHSDPDRMPKIKGLRFPTEATSGELRLVRKGDTLHYLVKDETTAGQFKELYQTDFGAGALSAVRFVVNTNGEPVATEARLVDLRIQFGGAAAVAGPGRQPAGDLPAPEARPLAPGPTRSDKRTLTVVLLAGVVFSLALALGLGTWLFLRQRRRPELASDDHLSLVCPECGKKLKVRPELAGKRIKCVQCGGAVVARNGA